VENKKALEDQGLSCEVDIGRANSNQFSEGLTQTYEGITGFKI
jgi:hypothetical protein